MNESLGRFDDLIRGEREQIARERDAHAASKGGTTAGEDAGAGEAPDASGDQQRDGDMKQASTQSSQESSGGEQNSAGDMKSDGKSTGGGGRGGTGGRSDGPGSNVPPEVPDGSDDDIIARQIREAAEKETDPELRDKLWKEYIEYKKNAKAKS